MKWREEPDPMEALIRRPWQRIPAEYVCCLCGRAATGADMTRGVIMFHCDREDHDHEAAEALMQLTDAGGVSGYHDLRMPWGRWLMTLRGRYWRARHPVRAWRRRQERSAGHERLAGIFDTMPQVVYGLRMPASRVYPDPRRHTGA